MMKSVVCNKWDLNYKKNFEKLCTVFVDRVFKNVEKTIILCLKVVTKIFLIFLQEKFLHPCLSCKNFFLPAYAIPFGVHHGHIKSCNAKLFKIENNFMPAKKRKAAKRPVRKAAKRKAAPKRKAAKRKSSKRK